MKHILLTRFNTLVPSWNTRRHLNHDWLDARFMLFEEVCLPSVAGQTNHNFDWFIFFDSNTPEQYRLKINTLLKKYKFHPIFVDEFNVDSIKTLIAERFLEAGDDMLLTSRLDSDDALATHYIETLQSLASSRRDRVVFNFDCGAVLSTVRGKRSLYEHEDVSNPFANLLEPFKPDFTTVLWVDHTTLASFAEVHHIKEKSMWLQRVHGFNISNRARGKRIRINAYNDNFPYLLSISAGVKESDMNIFFDNYILGPYRKLRDFTITATKKYCKYNERY